MKPRCSPGAVRKSVKSAEKASKSPKKPQETFVMDIPPSLVGCVIGRAGARIKAIQRETTCSVWIDQDVPNDHPRKMFFVGDRASVAYAVAKVEELKALAGADSDSPSWTSIVVDCPADAIGALIGKGGSTIQRIQQLSGAVLSLNQSVKERLPRKIVIAGHPDSIRAASALIEEALRGGLSVEETLAVSVHEPPLRPHHAASEEAALLALAESAWTDSTKFIDEALVALENGISGSGHQGAAPGHDATEEACCLNAAAPFWSPGQVSGLSETAFPSACCENSPDIIASIFPGLSSNSSSVTRGLYVFDADPTRGCSGPMCSNSVILKDELGYIGRHDQAPT